MKLLEQLVKIMLNPSVNVNTIECFILLVLLLPFPLNGNSLNGGSSGDIGLDPNRNLNAPADPSQQHLHRRMTDERYSHDKVINTVVNINDSNAAEVLNIFNVSKDDVLRRIESFSHSQPNNLNSRPQNAERHMDHEMHANSGNNSSRPGMESEKEMFIESFKRRIVSAVDRNSSRHMSDVSTAAIHDMAFYPLCSKNNQTSWLEENTAKLYFSSSIFDKLIPNTYLHRAILRLRQKIPENLAVTDASVTSEPDLQNGCSDVDDIIHVKISIFVKRSLRGGNNRFGNSANYGSGRREPKPVLKKFVCHSFTLNRVNNEWVEIDVRQVIKNWEKMYRAAALHNKGGTVADPMVAIDVEDEYQQPLKAGLFFEPTDCQASPAIPWNLYGDNIRSLFGTQVLPDNPRLDIKWSRLRPHRHRSHHMRNMNHLENISLLNDSPLMEADYQYQASTDQSQLNFVSTSTNNRNHRKRYAQGHTSDIGSHFNEQHRMRRSLNNNMQNNNRSHKNNTKRKFIARVD